MDANRQSQERLRSIQLVQKEQCRLATAIQEASTSLEHSQLPAHSKDACLELSRVIEQTGQGLGLPR